MNIPGESFGGSAVVVLGVDFDRGSTKFVVATDFKVVSSYSVGSCGVVANLQKIVDAVSDKTLLSHSVH